jgi:hypothetical protein
MSQRAFVTKFAVSLDKPLTDLLLSTFFGSGMGEWTRMTRSACPYSMKLAWDMA